MTRWFNFADSLIVLNSDSWLLLYELSLPVEMAMIERGPMPTSLQGYSLRSEWL